MSTVIREPVTALVGLGANLGDPRFAVSQAIQALGQLPGTRLVASSRLFASAPIQATGPDFVNAVARLSTRLDACELWSRMSRIELEAGRQRPFANAPRTLDLDLLTYGDGSIDSPVLKIPHPRMYLRAFVLLPLADVAPELVTPACLAAVMDQPVSLLTQDRT